MSDPATAPWWQSGIIYQIYPRSFQDTTGSGMGDLNGIRKRLPHVADLGADAIWISPIYPSPMKDAGYDITDYTGIEPLFGTIDDFRALTSEAHDLGLKVLLDFVPAHSSDRHPWFLDSRSGHGAEKREWYVWRDPQPDGSPPNNWLSEFGGPAWTWEPATEQYYLHIYAREQPALNWRNKAVQEAMLGAMRTWYERGVDGFRVDAVEHLAPDHLLRDNPANPDWVFSEGPARSLFRTFTSHQSDVFPIVRRMRALAEEYGGRLLVGEAYGMLEEIMLYYGDGLDGFQLPFNFELISAPWDPVHIADFADRYERMIPPGGWPNWVLGNHDRDRIATRVGPEQARVAAMMLLTLRGTPTLWQGDELGMLNEPVPEPMLQDPWAINNPGTGLGRDPVRIPFPWEDAAPGRGFTTGQPFLPLSSVASASRQAGDPASMLSLVRSLIAFRRAQPALSLGSYERVHAGDGVFAYARAQGNARLAVALNLTAEPRALPIRGEARLSTIHDRTLSEVESLLPNEGVILRI